MPINSKLLEPLKLNNGDSDGYSSGSDNDHNHQPTSFDYNENSNVLKSHTVT